METECSAFMIVAEYIMKSIIGSPYPWLLFSYSPPFFLHSHMHLRSVDVKYEFLLSQFFFHQLYILFEWCFFFEKIQKTTGYNIISMFHHPRLTIVNMFSLSFFLGKINKTMKIKLQCPLGNTILFSWHNVVFFDLRAGSLPRVNTFLAKDESFLLTHHPA